MLLNSPQIVFKRRGEKVGVGGHKKIVGTGTEITVLLVICGQEYCCEAVLQEVSINNPKPIEHRLSCSSAPGL